MSERKDVLRWAYNEVIKDLETAHRVLSDAGAPRAMSSGPWYRIMRRFEDDIRSLRAFEKHLQEYSDDE